MTPLDIESLREHHYLSGLERQLLDAVEELTRQLDDARDIAARAGAFVSGSGEVVRCWDCGALDDGNPCHTCAPPNVCPLDGTEYIDHCGPCAAAS